MPLEYRPGRVWTTYRHGLVLALLFLASATAAREPGWISQAYHRSFMHEGLQKYEEAIKALSPVHSAYPNAYTVNLRLGWLNYLAGHHANAIAAYRKAIQAAPQAVEPRLGLLLPLLAQQKYEQAEQLAVQVLRTDLYNYLGNLRLLQALQAQRKLEAARTVAQRMLVLYPANVTFLQQLAEVEAAAGNEKRARSLFQSVHALDPENVAARRFLQLKGAKP